MHASEFRKHRQRMAVMPKILRLFAAFVVVSAPAVLVSPGVSEAGLGAGATPSFPAAVTVGDAGVPAAIQLVNNNTPPNTTSTVCNFGDPLPCPNGDPGITLIPSCGQLGAFSACTPSGADPGVFAVSTTGVGLTGSACAGMTFAITPIDPVFGRLRFTPQPPGAHVVLPTATSSCQINFTFDVQKTPAVDQDPVTPGLQTVQVVDFTQHDAGTITASGRGTSIGTRVDRATPTINTIASTNVVVGGALTDQATVSGRVNPQPGATVDFRLYGPNDTTCSAAPVFESLAIAYPVSGGPVSSAAYTPTEIGTYRWVATFNGDANNAAVAGACGNVAESVTVSASPAIASLAPAPAVVVPVVPAIPANAVLPATGSNHGSLLLLAFGLSVAGALLVASTRLKVRRSLP